jgi:hypothetical protein
LAFSSGDSSALLNQSASWDSRPFGILAGADMPTHQSSISSVVAMVETAYRLKLWQAPAGLASEPYESISARTRTDNIPAGSRKSTSSNTE